MKSIKIIVSGTIVLLSVCALIYGGTILLSNAETVSDTGAAAKTVAATSGSAAAVTEPDDESASGSAVSLKKLYKDTPATKIIDITGASDDELKTLFYIKKIDDETFKGMKGKSWHKGCPVGRKELRRVRILYYGFDKKTHVGELITNASIAKTCRKIFRKLYFKKYELKKVQPIDAYDGDDTRSMEDNNTSCFNHRVVAGTSSLSKHAYGLALDINPRHNPYVIKNSSPLYVSPENGRKFADRTKKFKHKITHGSIIFKFFHKEGFFWGGDWIYTKDYQHFQKSS